MTSLREGGYHSQRTDTRNDLSTHSGIHTLVVRARHRVVRGVAAPIVLIAMSGVRAVRAGGMILGAVVVGKRLVVPGRGTTVASVVRPAAGRRMVAILAHV